MTRRGTASACRVVVTGTGAGHHPGIGHRRGHAGWTALVSGGGVGAIPTAATELFEPASGRWRPGGTMVEARRGHQAVVLDDGRVLVAGGFAGGRPLDSADVTRETWSATGAMASARLGHSLSLLADGRVLAAGGTSLEGATTGQGLAPVATSEVYDPRTGTRAPGPAMTTPRFEHTATRLADGRVLLVGGLGPATEGGLPAPVAATELFDPAAGAFVGSTPLAEPRSNHVAAELADRRILVAGGLGGAQTDGALRSTEIFDPVDGSWRRAASLVHARSGATGTTLSGGAVLVVGGEAVDRGARRSHADAEILLQDSGEWADAGRMTCPRSEHVAVRLPDGSVLIAAGDGVFPGRAPVAQGCVDRYQAPAARTKKG